MDTELDERKRKILKAIIQTYLETGEPVGSRTISKYTDLNLSSATIRNEMSDLEEMGYILQPHTSAGRIPSDKGYRLYVDELMREKEQEVADIKNMVIEKTDRMEKVLQQVVKVLASSTNYATLITGPEYHRNKVKFIQLSKVNEEQLLAVIVVEGNLVKNQMIDLDETINDEQILKLNLLLNTQLNGLTIEEINLGMIKKMKEQAGIHSGIISKVVDTVAEAIAVSEEDVPVYTSGATNIFKYPELSDSSKASQLISTFEERQKLVDMIKGAAEEQDGEENTFIFSDSNSRKLTKEEVLRLSAWDTKLAKNEIYARHNRKFDNQKIQAYFDSQQWYHGTVAPSDFDEDVFNEYEKANVELLKKAEDGTLTASTSSGTSSTDDGYIISDSSIRELTDSDLSGLSKSKLRIARNEIYARHHRKFDSADLQIYFDKKSWYSGTIEPSDFDEKNELSQIEKKNIDLIKKYE